MVIVLILIHFISYFKCQSNSFNFSFSLENSHYLHVTRLICRRNRAPQPIIAPKKSKKQPKVGGAASVFRVKSKAKKANTQKNNAAKSQKEKLIMTVTNTEHFGIQRKIVANMTSQSWHDVPHVCYNAEVDFGKLLYSLKVLNAERDKENRISVNTLVLKIICEALKESPVMNSHISFSKNLVRGRIDTFKEINISMPMILPNGKMMTVNLRDFGEKNLDEMSDYIKDVSRRAVNTNLDEAMFEVSMKDTLKEVRRGRLHKAIFRLIGSKTGKHKVKTLKGKEKRAYLAVPESERLTSSDLEQGTVTVSNIGSLYKSQTGEMTLLEIVPPQVCAFGVGALKEVPCVVTLENGKKEVGIKTVLPICIAFDHRALDFGDVIPFIKKLDGISASPELVICTNSEKEKNACA